MKRHGSRKRTLQKIPNSFHTCPAVAVAELLDSSSLKETISLVQQLQVYPALLVDKKNCPCSVHDIFETGALLQRNTFWNTAMHLEPGSYWI